MLSGDGAARPSGLTLAALVAGVLHHAPGMSTHITTDCINCGACVPECPNEAIAEGNDIYAIDAARCTECVGFHEKEACQSVCPVECCLPDPNRTETEAALIARAVKLHPNDAKIAAAAASGQFPSRFRT